MRLSTGNSTQNWPSNRFEQGPETHGIEDDEATKSPSEGLSIIHDNGDVALDIRVSPEEETVWMTRNQIADLFDTTRQNVSTHIDNILQDGELETGATRKYYLQVQPGNGSRANPSVRKRTFSLTRNNASVCQRIATGSTKQKQHQKNDNKQDKSERDERR